MSGRLRRRLDRIRLTTGERRLLLVVLCAPLLGLVGVIAADAVPDSRIADHLLDGQRAGILTRDARREPTPLDTLAPSPTECLAFSVGLGDQPGRNHVTTAIVSPTYVEARGFLPCRILARNLDVFESTGTLPPGTSYLRYWHGYAALTRPALGLFGVAGTRWIAFTLLAVSMGAMAFAVARTLGLAVTAILLAPTLLTTDTLIGGFTAHSAIGMATAWAGGWMSFALVSRRPVWTTAALVAALAGVLSAYLDLMTAMPAAYALAVAGAALGVIAARGAAALRDGWRVTAGAAIGWVIGLAWMWASKWVIAAITVGVDEVVDSVRSRVDLYVSGDRRVSPSRTEGLTDSLDAWWSRPLAPWIVLGILAVLVVAAVRGRNYARTVAGSSACAAIAAVPAVGWYLALSAHSQIHAFLVYRSLPVAFGAAAAVLYVGLMAPRGAARSASAEQTAVPVDTSDTASVGVPAPTSRQ
jgi:hypothetical protein